MMLFSSQLFDEYLPWLFEKRKNHSPNSDIWHFRFHMNSLKDTFLNELNEGSYTFSPLQRYEFEDETVSMWSAQDLMALKLITDRLQNLLKYVLSPGCYHLKGHGGLKKALTDTVTALPDYKYVLRSDIKSYGVVNLIWLQE